MNPFEKYKSIFIFEGITGCGKSTQLPKVVDYLERKRGLSVGIADSGAEAYVASKAYRNYLTRADNPLIPYALIHQSTNYLKIEAARNPVDVLMVDRFVLSDLVYLISRCELQGIPVDKEKTREQILSPFGIDIFEKTYTIYLDASIEVAKSRTQSRSQLDSFGKVRSEFDLPLQARARENYLNELNMAKKRNSFSYTTIDANGPEEVVFDRIKDYVSSSLANAPKIVSNRNIEKGG